MPDSYSHMRRAEQTALEPQKSPRQDRSITKVRSIKQATIQVLAEEGPKRLTTVRVAQKASVSVGSLYQYFPNKRSLLLMVLEEHLASVATAVEDACRQSHAQPLDAMAARLVHDFVDAKLGERKIAVAFYRISAQVGGDLIVDRFRSRCQNAIAAMLRSAFLRPSADLEYAANAANLVFLTMAGVLRGYLESGAPRTRDKQLREHHATLTCAYCEAV